MDLVSTIQDLISNNETEKLEQVMREKDLVVRNGKIEHKNKDEVAFWDKRQLVKKINLNS